MSYVPVKMWVPDTADGPVADSVDLKPCDTCKALVPIDFMDEHVSQAHPTLTPTPH